MVNWYNAPSYQAEPDIPADLDKLATSVDNNFAKKSEIPTDSITGYNMAKLAESYIEVHSKSPTSTFRVIPVQFTQHDCNCIYGDNTGQAQIVKIANSPHEFDSLAWEDWIPATQPSDSSLYYSRYALDHLTRYDLGLLTALKNGKRKLFCIYREQHETASIVNHAELDSSVADLAFFARTPWRVSICRWNNSTTSTNIDVFGFFMINPTTKNLEWLDGSTNLWAPPAQR